MKEQWFIQRNAVLQAEWSALDNSIDIYRDDLDKLVEKEDNVYRVILDSEPLSDEERQAGTGGSNGSPEVPYGYIQSTLEKMDRFNRQLSIEQQSLGEIMEVLNNKLKMWHSRPAIQPISNGQLDHLYTTFGIRFHPIHNLYREHKGLDFVAPSGTNVFATGDGSVYRTYRSVTYGNVVFINHGYGYQTRYAHLSEISVEQGQDVKRGQVIGHVGSTGLSVASHLHYEVLYHGDQVNPINFFQRDLSNEEYQKLIEKANDSNPSLDY